jgi:hypothetical protein
MATAPSPNDLTRQQLDELDALLQRMLSLPLNPPEVPMAAAPPMPEPPVPPSWRVDPPAASMTASAPHLLLTDPPAPPAPPPSPPPAPAPRPVSRTAPPIAPAAPATPQAAMPAPAPAPRPRPAAPQLAPAPSATGLTPVPAAPPVPFVFLPLVALNAAFDALCGLLGWPGRVLRSGFFKHLYGLAGLALVAYTIAHIAQVQGWAALPVPLPWPR